MKPLHWIAVALVVLIVALFISLRGSPGPVAVTPSTAPADSPEPPAMSAAGTPGPAASATASSPSVRHRTLSDLLVGSSGVSRDALERFVAANGRSAHSLLAAWADSQDQAWLLEAAERYPGDPAVQFVILSERTFPEDRAEWMQRLRESSPDNGAVDFLAASRLLSSGDKAAAFDLLRAAMEKPVFDEFSGPLDAARDALNKASYADPVEALLRLFDKAPHNFPEVVDTLTNALFDDQKVARERGDQAAAVADLELAIRIGRLLSGPDATPMPVLDINGAAIEAKGLRLLLEQPGQPPNPAAQARLAELRAGGQELLRVGAIIQQTPLTDPFLAECLTRSRTEGTNAAYHWYAGQKGL